MRTVILICGPPGAGKTTRARNTGLTVYDRDDTRWRHGGEAAFKRAIAQLAHDPDAQAAVIRPGATRQARAQAAALIGATHTEIITTPLDVCIERITTRKRRHPPLATQIAAATTWWQRYEPPLDDDHAPAAWQSRTW